jgi:hypothetical protein
MRGQQLAQHRLRDPLRTGVVAVNDAGHAAEARDHQMCDRGRRSMELRNVRRRDARQLGVRDDLATQRRKAQGGAVTAAAVEGLLDVAIGSEAQQQPSSGTWVICRVAAT